MKSLWILRKEQDMSPLQKALVLSLGSVLAFAQASPSSASGQSSSGSSQSSGQTAGRAGASSSSADQSSASGSATKSSGSASLSGADRKFIEHAAVGGKKEVALGRMAAERASNPDVKAFGQMMVDDHSKANSELETLAQQKGVTLPAEKTDSNQNKLSRMSGDQFDRAYISLMQADHQKDVAEFEKASTSASDPDVKAFAAKTLPVLQQHKDKVNSLKAGMTGGSRMSSNGGSGTGSTTTNGNNTNNANNANRDATSNAAGGSASQK